MLKNSTFWTTQVRNNYFCVRFLNKLTFVAVSSNGNQNLDRNKRCQGMFDKSRLLEAAIRDMIRKAALEANDVRKQNKYHQEDQHHIHKRFAPGYDMFRSWAEQDRMWRDWPEQERKWLEEQRRKNNEDITWSVVRGLPGRPVGFGVSLIDMLRTKKAEWDADDVRRQNERRQ